MYSINELVRGTRIISGQEAKSRRSLLNQLVELAEAAGFDEIILPSIEAQQIYADKAGKEVLGQMYTFPDKKGRQLCLRPEGTATIQLIADKHYRRGQEGRFWYFERCWRYEKPQRGRYREFFQFGIEVINPKSDPLLELIALAESMITIQTNNYSLKTNALRGLNYYTGDGFEISCPTLGTQSQIVGGGRYRQGVGFAIGFDRLMLC